MDPDQVAAPVADGGANPPPAQQQSRSLTPEEQPASPEEQAQYEKFVGKAFMLIYDKTFFPKVVDMLEGEGDPIEGLARSAAMVVSRVMRAAEGAGEELSGDVLFHGAKEVFEDLAELSRQAGIKDFSKDEDALEGAYFRGLDQLRVVLEGSGDINRESAQADLAMLQQMDEDGELEGLFRSLAAGDDSPGARADGGDEEPAEDATPPAASESAPAAPVPNAPSPQKRGLMPKGMN